MKKRISISLQIALEKKSIREKESERIRRAGGNPQRVDGQQKKKKMRAHSSSTTVDVCLVRLDIQQ
jgi:hypothetical protein